MRIRDLVIHVLEAPLSQPFRWSFSEATTRQSCIVEVVAEDGTTGIGECFGPARLNAAVVSAFKPLVVGKDALATDAIWQSIYNGLRDQGQKGLVVTALLGVDIALWDLKGKLLGQPRSIG